MFLFAKIARLFFLADNALCTKKILLYSIAEGDRKSLLAVGKDVKCNSLPIAKLVAKKKTAIKICWLDFKV